MIAIDEDETTIYLTKGDATGTDYNVLAFKFPIWNPDTEEEENYQFKPSDKITFTVFDKKGYTKKEILKKEYTLSELGYVVPTEFPELPLTSVETKKFELLNKKKTYWYDLVLNDSTTILGFDDEGAKKMIVFPESEEE